MQPLAEREGYGDLPACGGNKSPMSSRFVIRLDTSGKNRYTLTWIAETLYLKRFTANMVLA
jgi:hypothetical protein